MSYFWILLVFLRVFDLTFCLFSSEEQQPLEDFFKAKGIRIKNEMAEESSTLLKAALDNNDLDSSGDEGVAADRGSADEDSDSPDEDFNASSDSDVAEEFDSDHESSGGSDEEMADASDGGGDKDVDMDETSRPKKKSKTGK